ncbi:alkene reductase [Fulvivirga sp. M361]|uniref:alkene reductase n=1 Tax=Fulvivirga sp. M361 TaxID=2594266 RepID=UPI00117A132F|nr:alkene reductase [Fulvivirga sp. M361]TRX56055.1 alkene reductase [Fulvivirga sp. M361]
MSNTKLFSPYTLGQLALRNRVIMAPMTRCRAHEHNALDELAATYYGQRATAGLIITEGTSPSPNGLGYARIPGVYSDQQIAGWKSVTKAVHEKGGKIFLQIMHTGRVSHEANLPEGAEVVAPTTKQVSGEMYTDSQGPLPHTTPRKMNEADIDQAIEEYVQGAKNAIAAGFDGVELHAANGYLMEQFLNPLVNDRNDEYGGSIENRCRFVLEVAERTAEAIGKDKVGIRISPYGTFNDMGAFDDVETQFVYLAEKLKETGLVYIHIVDHATMGTAPVPVEVKHKIREAFQGTIIISGGYDKERAEKDLEEGLGHLVAFGRPYVSNPDLVERMKKGAALTPPDFDTFYTPGEKGYTDYPTLEEEKVG